MSKIVFLDTNIYLHYQLFDQINWLEILKANAVTIVIPPVTVRELNKHKDLHSRPRVKKRAGAVLKKLNALFESGSRARLRDGIDVLFEDRDPMIDFAAYQLSHEIQDDHLIASIIMCQSEMPEAEIVLVTSDAGLALRAKAMRQGIATIKLPDNLKLAEEPDPSEKRIKELEQELRELKRRIPQLSLTFEDGSQHATFALPHPVELTQEELKNKLEEIEQRYPKMEKQSKQSREPPEPLASLAELAAGLSSLDTVSSEDVVEYNAKLDEFYQRYAKYLQKHTWFENLKRRTVKLTILLANDGTAPAEDIDVFMHFPDGFGLTSEGGYPESPEPLKPPPRPRTLMQKLSGLSSFSVPALPSLAPYRPEPIFPSPSVSAPNIKRTNSYDVDFHVQRIKHTLQEPFEALYVVFESFESAHSFQIDYEILAANRPKEMTGKLHVIIKKDRE
jgi:hypothetical protein